MRLRVWRRESKTKIACAAMTCFQHIHIYLSVLRSNILQIEVTSMRVCFVCLNFEALPSYLKPKRWAKVVSILRDQQAKGELPSFRLVELNGMRLIKPHQVSPDSSRNTHKISSFQRVSLSTGQKLRAEKLWTRPPTNARSLAILRLCAHVCARLHPSELRLVSWLFVVLFFRAPSFRRAFLNDAG